MDHQAFPWVSEPYVPIRNLEAADLPDFPTEEIYVVQSEYKYSIFVQLLYICTI
jgi:hypothetical protein